jgi:dephospho-CoA kinase
MDGAHNDRRRWITKNIFLIGYAGSGKDETGRFLRRHGYSLTALAEPIKAVCSEHLGRPVTKADRALLIEFGQSYRRWFGETFWCHFADDDMRIWNRYPAAITDGRHLVEYDYFVTQRGFVPVRIVAPDEVRFERLLKRDGVDQRWVDAHERELDNVDIAYTIVNDGTLDELEAKVEAMLAKINGGD